MKSKQKAHISELFTKSRRELLELEKEVLELMTLDKEPFLFVDLRGTFHFSPFKTFNENLTMKWADVVHYVRSGCDGESPAYYRKVAAKFAELAKLLESDAAELEAED